MRANWPTHPPRIIQPITSCWRGVGSTVAVCVLTVLFCQLAGPPTAGSSWFPPCHACHTGGGQTGLARLHRLCTLQNMAATHSQGPQPTAKTDAGLLMLIHPNLKESLVLSHFIQKPSCGAHITQSNPLQKYHGKPYAITCNQHCCTTCIHCSSSTCQPPHCMKWRSQAHCCPRLIHRERSSPTPAR